MSEEQEGVGIRVEGREKQDGMKAKPAHMLFKGVMRLGEWQKGKRSEGAAQPLCLLSVLQLLK